ncbi:hypothetical protein [Burkholderia gladioli]|nr:hypothetical protein [Burkholderia gladioli]MBU9379050.1 hypothetical protein [Burkholderia gladioli]
MSPTQIPPIPDPDVEDLPEQDDLPETPPEPLRDPERVPPLPVNAVRRTLSGRAADRGPHGARHA